MADAQEEILALTDVHKWVGNGPDRIHILSGVSLTLRRGEFVAVMGASGSGKSTLMNLIGLLDVPSAGSLRLLGQDVSSLADDHLAILRAESIGFIFQSFNLLPYLNAQENVELPMSYAHSRQALHDKSRKLLETMNLSHRTRAYPMTLSGGERQRVAIARALANNPQLLLADEPTGALDSKTGVQILDLLKDLNRQGATIVVVTHDESVAKRAQRILRMRDGRFE
jgi:ABC-type lipoprotein export system ATPase subunit